MSRARAGERRRGARQNPVLTLAGPGPLYQQLYVKLRELVLTGVLSPGSRLASTRAMACSLAVSRFTVVNAVERLLAEGYFVAKRGAGTFVATDLPESAMNALALPSARRPTRDAPPAVDISARGKLMTAVVITGPRHEFGEPRPFRPRRPPLDVFPVSLWARLVRREWRRSRYERLDYGEPAGYRPLRQAIASHIRITRGVRCTAEQVIVTSGSQQAFDLVFRLLLDEGDAVWLEDPGPLESRAALGAAGARLIPVPVDTQGLVVDEGRRRARRARMAVVSPSHQYPMGTTLSVARRVALLDWARANGAWVVEDDYDSYFRYRGRPMSALQGLDSEMSGGSSARVVYIGTFSKTAFPSLRLGFCIVPESLVEPLSTARAIADRNSPLVDQAVLAEFILGGHYDTHLRKVRAACVERHEALRLYFAKVFGTSIQISPAQAGTHVLGWLTSNPEVHSSLVIQLARCAADDDLVVFPLSRYFIESPSRDALILGYGGLRPERIRAGAERLARSYERALRLQKSASRR